jgi:hypothetical protein
VDAGAWVREPDPKDEEREEEEWEREVRGTLETLKSVPVEDGYDLLEQLPVALSLPTTYLGGWYPALQRITPSTYRSYI